MSKGQLVALKPPLLHYHEAVNERFGRSTRTRGNSKFTGDFTAFDALVRYTDVHGRNGFVAFEIKYSESMREACRN
jgi:hypothetical protein